jgi:ribonucleoside-triphosphate reductase
MKLEWKNIKNLVKSNSDKIVKISVRDGKTIRVTPNHPVSVITPQGLVEKPAVAVSKGEFLLSLKSAEDCLSREIQKIGSQDLDGDMAKLLGFFLADGNFLFENRKNLETFGLEKGIQFTFPGNCSYFEEIKSLGEKKFGAKSRIKEDPRYGTIYAYFYNSKLVRELSKAGLKKYEKLLPQIWNSPKSVIESFLDGFFLGDGYEKRGEIHINDLGLARELVMLYHLVGRPVTFRAREKSQVITLQHGKSRRSDGLLGNPPLFQRVPAWKVNTGRVPGLTHNRSVGLMTLQYYDAHTELTKKLLGSDAYPVEVMGAEIEELPQDIEFYDIELEENHRFVHSLGTITHNCCRLNLNMNEIIKRPGGTFAIGDSTGSIGVVTLNVNRMAYESKSKQEFFEKIRHYMALAKTSLEIKREIISKNLKNGLMPYTKAYLGTFRNHFSTIGLCGMNEACLNLLGKNIKSPEGKQLAIETLKFMRELCLEFQKQTGNLYNLEATPAESASFRLGKLDKETYPDIITAGRETPYLTNSTHLPVDETDDIIEALEHQNDIQPLYTGGTIFHTFLGEKVSSGEACKQLVKKIAYNSRLPYFSITPTFSVCPEHGYVAGEHFLCPLPAKKKGEAIAATATAK